MLLKVCASLCSSYDRSPESHLNSLTCIPWGLLGGNGKIKRLKNFSSDLWVDGTKTTSVEEYIFLLLFCTRPTFLLG